MNRGFEDAGVVERAARAIAAGDVVAHGFANFYAITARPDAATVRQVNLMKGRPADQVGSVTTTPSRAAELFDWTALPDGLTMYDALSIIDAFFSRGPFGFLGPAARDVPAHLTRNDGPTRTVQLIAAGYRCPSQRFVASAMHRVGADFLYITSANRSHHLTGAGDEPAHYRSDALAADFFGEPGFRLFPHADEEAAWRAYPQFATTSTTILSLHKTAGVDARGRPVLVVERHGGLPIDEVARVLDTLGFGVMPGSDAPRLLPRRYLTAAPL